MQKNNGFPEQNSKVPLGKIKTLTNKQDKKEPLSTHSDSTKGNFSFKEPPSSHFSLKLTDLTEKSYHKKPPSHNFDFKKKINTLPQNPFDKIAPPKEIFSDLNKIVISSTFSRNSVNLSQEIIMRFNEHIKPGKTAFERNSLKGHKIPPGTVLLGSRNGVAELHGPTNELIYHKQYVKPGKQASIEKLYKLSDPFYGLNGVYVLNVPQGHYAKGFLHGIERIFDEGPHVIHDVEFKLDGDNYLVSKWLHHIKHGKINIVRVPSGQLAKINLNSRPYVLDGRQLPYVFDNCEFELIEIVNESEWYIEHSTIRILRVPPGKIAKIYINDNAKLLESRPEPYIYRTGMFKIATPRVIYPHTDYYFYEATKKMIKHGPIKRIMPRTGEVAVTYNGGNLEIYYPSEDGKAIIIDSPTHKVTGFLKIGNTSLSLPSVETRKQRKKANKKISFDELNYEVFSTKDSINIGLNLLVTFEIVDPMLALTKLSKYKKILGYIEEHVLARTGQVIQQLHSTVFTPTLECKETITFTAESLPADFQNSIKEVVKRDLKIYGIEVHSIFVKSTKILDEAIQKSLREASALEENFKLEKRKIHQQAKIDSINTDRHTQDLVAKAQADLAVAKIMAEAEEVKAEAQAKAKKTRAAAELETKVHLGEVYSLHPALLEHDLETLRMKALSKCPGTVVLNNTKSLLPPFQETTTNRFFGGFSTPIPISKKNLTIKSEGTDYLDHNIPPPY